MKQLISEIIQNRQSVKHFASTPIDESAWNSIKEMIYWSASSYTAQPYRTLVINQSAKNAPLIAELANVTWALNQPLITEPPKLVLFISLKREVFATEAFISPIALGFITQVFKESPATAQVSQARVTKDYLRLLALNEDDSDEWAAKEAHIALANSLVAAAIVNVGSSAIGGFDRKAFEAVLHKHQLISEHERLAAAAAFGYPRDAKAYAHKGTNERFRQPMPAKISEI